MHAAIYNTTGDMNKRNYIAVSHIKKLKQGKAKPHPSSCGGNIVHVENVPPHKLSYTQKGKKKKKKKLNFSYVLRRPQLILLVEIFLHIEVNTVITLFRSILAILQTLLLV